MYYSGDDEASLGRAGWYSGNSKSKRLPVGQKEANAFGLYDMHGNSWEWCEDDWHESYEGAPTDGSAWIDKPRGRLRVVRGGSWYENARRCRSASRDALPPDYRIFFYGFRLAAVQPR
jgi:formylglycine-generating enzyme required for sulfatase activity